MAIEAGDKAPKLELKDQDGNTVTLEDYAGKKLILYFYPKAFTSGCTVQACDFRDRHETFTARGYEIAGVSPDPVDKLEAFREEHDLRFTMLSDEDHSVAEAYGAWGKKQNYGREYEGIIRSTFVIDENGVVEQAWRNVRAKGHADRLLTEVG
jgi:peroxiredoxin Q/BCP